MRLVKIEKPNCPGCDKVGAFLDNQDVCYEKSDITKDAFAREVLGELNLFSVPVTVLVDEENKVQDHVLGTDFAKLEALVDKVK